MSSADAVVRAAIDVDDPLDETAECGDEEEAPVAPIELAAVHVERGRAARASLATLSPNAAADEILLLDLVGEEVALVDALHLAAGRLAGRLIEMQAQPTGMLTTAKALREIIATQCALNRRIEGALGAAATLRAQRQFLDHAQAAKRAR